MTLRATISQSGSLRSTRLRDRRARLKALFRRSSSSGVYSPSFNNRLIGIARPTMRRENSRRLARQNLINDVGRSTGPNGLFMQFNARRTGHEKSPGQGRGFQDFKFGRDQYFATTGPPQLKR